MDISIIDPGAETIYKAFGMSERRFNELHDRANKKLHRLCIDDPYARDSEAIIVIVSCCDTDQEALIMTICFFKKQMFIKGQLSVEAALHQTCLS